LKRKVFLVVSNVFGLKNATRIENLSIHDLRHAAITRMIRAGIPHTEVMKISGHTTMKTFMRYLNMVDETIQDNAALLDKFLSSSK